MIAKQLPFRLLAVLLTLTLQACATTPPKPDAPQATYVYVTLKTGPKSGSFTPEESARIFQGHMANMHRLADAGKLLVAGPFDKPHDPTWRGIFVMDVPTVELAQALVATDPGTMAGAFSPEFIPMHASPTLRQTLELERVLTAQTTANTTEKPDPTLPPPNIRSYVMVSANDAAKARKAIAASPLNTKIVWSGLFEAPRTHAGVFVLDSDKPANVETALATLDPGPCTIDAWWSTTSLTNLPADAKH